MTKQCRRMTRITQGEANLLSSLERSYLDTNESFTAGQALQAITVTGNKKGRSFSMKLTGNKIGRILRKSEDYEVVRRTLNGRLFWRRVQ